MAKIFLRSSLLVGIALLSFTVNSVCAEPAKTNSPSHLNWTDVRSLGVEGRGWDDTKSFYDRFPTKAETKVRPPVWNLSRQSAGMLVRFASDTTEIHARWALTSTNLAMTHMPATGVSGLDL